MTITSILSSEYCRDEAKSYEFIEALIWKEGPTCPHCKAQDRISKMKGKSSRTGTYKCNHGRKLDKEFEHTFFNHSAGQYGRGELNSNTVEGNHSNFKRGLKDDYRRCSEKHSHG